jgi:hypothetical protein
MLTTLEPDEFKKKRRDELLQYDQYSQNFEFSKHAFEAVAKSLASHPPCVSAHKYVRATSQRAFSASTHLTNCFSSGHSISELRALFPSVVDHWESYAHHQIRFHATEEYSGADVAHVALLGKHFHWANELICFALLLGHRSLIPRLLPIIDYNNPQKDGMLERMVEQYRRELGPLPDKCTRHLPYFKTLKIFEATPDKRPGLMATYLSEWYQASRREPYHGSEGQDFFTGYFSYESAAITFILDIDDSSYRSAPFYPVELVDFARQFERIKS